MNFAEFELETLQLSDFFNFHQSALVEVCSWFVFCNLILDGFFANLEFDSVLQSADKSIENSVFRGTVIGN